MSKFNCRCGAVIDLVPSPSPQEWLLVPEIDVELAAQETTEAAIFAAIDHRSISVIRCTNGDRIWMQIGEGAGQFQAFRPEIIQED